MEVFSKSYLEAVVRTQGELFDSFARQNPDCDTDDFITAYMNGKTRADIDAGQAYVCTMNAQELVDWFVSKSQRGLQGTEGAGCHQEHALSAANRRDAFPCGDGNVDSRGDR